MLKIVRLASEKLLFWKIPNFTACLLPEQSIFKIFEKWNVIWVQFSMCVFCYVTWLYLKKKKKFNFTTGYPKLWSQIIREMYDSEKKWNPLANGYQIPSELKFSKKKCCTLMYTYCKSIYGHSTNKTFLTVTKRFYIW